MVSIPSLHVSTRSEAKGGAKVFISSRKDAAHSGVFALEMSVRFNPATDPYPSGSFKLDVDLSDALKASFSATSVELINAFGKHNPTVYLTGRCDVHVNEHAEAPIGCRYWLMIANNSRNTQEETPDIVGFAIHDRGGNRIAYGTGPVISGSGDIKVVSAA